MRMNTLLPALMSKTEKIFFLAITNLEQNMNWRIHFAPQKDMYSKSDWQGNKRTHLDRKTDRHIYRRRKYENRMQIRMCQSNWQKRADIIPSINTRQLQYQRNHIKYAPNGQIQQSVFESCKTTTIGQSSRHSTVGIYVWEDINEAMAIDALTDRQTD